jgi:ABC-type sugar transport system ATPase subunit
MPEVLGMAHRVLVMQHGRIVADLDREQCDMETLFAHAAGTGPAMPAGGVS